ncbi:MAG: SpoIVB peptidase [Eubacterium sp.]|nr:SpoIVB peptidase [Eubacterium sp.]
MKILHKYYWKFFIAALSLWMIMAGWMLYQMIPSHIYIKEGEEAKLQFAVPVTEKVVDAGEGVYVFDTLNKDSLTEAIHITGNSYVSTQDTGTFTIMCHLFGLFPVKEVQATIVEEQQLLPGGMTAGIYVQTKGVLVIGTGVVQAMTGEEVEPALNIVKSGDYITAVNGIPVEEKEQMIEQIEEAEGNKLVFTLVRDGKSLDVSLEPVYTDQKDYKVGIWVRDDIAGIGTISYVTEDMEYAILGHAINDMDSGAMVEIDNGTLYASEISDIVRGEIGSPGEMIGTISYSRDNVLGDIERNTDSGAFGFLNELPEELKTETGNDWLEPAFKQEIKMGAAQIISDVSGVREFYDIEIQALDYKEMHQNKGILFQVTDERLLSKTGGIIQGMSGSSIVQDGKIIGAVTHVLVNDPTKGYGIFIENMLEK